MYSRITTAGVKCYITSTQPRNTLTTAGRDSLRTLVDSINNNFGLYTIDFWDDLVTTDGLNNLKSSVNSGDGIHPNNTGHNYLFIRVRDKNIFQSNLVLPITLTGFSVSAGFNKTDLIKWTTAGEENNIRFEIQRSNDGISFSPVYTENTNISSQQDSFEWTDHESTGSMVYYRLKITEASGLVNYSSIVSIRNNYNNIVLNNIYFDHSAGNLSLQITSNESRTIILSIINTSGSVITTKKEFISSPGQTVSIPIQSISSGEYFIKVTTDDGQSVTKAFIK